MRKHSSKKRRKRNRKSREVTMYLQAHENTYRDDRYHPADQQYHIENRTGRVSVRLLCRFAIVQK